jgi:hypothetical protein
MVKKVVVYRNQDGEKRQVECATPQEVEVAVADAKIFAVGKVRVKDANGHNGNHKQPRDRACRRRSNNRPALN